MSGAVPEVTVVIACHNAMPQLTAGLDSLVGQSIRRRRPGALQVLAVDDGSTDDSGTELRRYEERHPELFTVLGGADPGGSAAAGNRALDRARGRFVLFLCAADRLGLEALERLVALADRAGSDVVLGRTVGVGGRQVAQEIFERTREQVTFTDSALAWALSDSKLFRRELLVGHSLRKREDLPAHCEQPFTLEACLHARRISVLADYDCYYAMPRPDRSPVTVRSRHEARLRGAAALLEVVERLAEPGPEQAVLRGRVFCWDVASLLRTEFLTLEEPVQRRLCAGVGRLLDRHCPPADFQQLAVRDRLRLDLARRGRVAALRRLIRYQAAYWEAAQPKVAGEREPVPVVPAPAHSVPVPVPVQLWRGIVPEQVRRRLRRQPAWRGFVERAYARWG
ncbi:glycosyltransferase family 2 protein [Kitasatospora azatica]|uniref:glycosyltransferase family 2 protein n=1 Tax=Kitasatospora azatica TaxID=58347 RepID=UPI000690DE79|nr:glycosyltransferase [Kitasatospora azatica]